MNMQMSDGSTAAMDTSDSGGGDGDAVMNTPARTNSTGSAAAATKASPARRSSFGRLPRVRNVDEQTIAARQRAAAREKVKPSIEFKRVGMVELGMLDDFELNRTVRPIVSDRQVRVPFRTINADLTCRVCLGIIRQCVAVVECMHRFCNACIEKYDTVSHSHTHTTSCNQFEL